MSVKKQFLKSRPECKVTFKLDKLPNAKSVNIVGDFNNWDTAETTMDKLKNGSFSKTCYLENGKQVQFRYLVDQELWLTEEEADGFADTGMDDQQKNAILDLN